MTYFGNQKHRPLSTRDKMASDRSWLAEAEVCETPRLTAGVGITSKKSLRFPTVFARVPWGFFIFRRSLVDAPQVFVSMISKKNYRFFYSDFS